MKDKLKYNLIPILVIILFSFITIGYALYGETVSLNGNVTIAEPGKIKIVSATYVTSQNVDNPTDPSIDGMNIDFTLKCNKSTCSVTYLISIENNSFYDYTFTNLPINATITTADNKTPAVTASITDVDTGKELKAGTNIVVGDSLNIRLKLDFELGESGTIGGSGNISASEDNSGNIVPISLSPNEGNLRGTNNIACFNVRVSNTFKYARSLHFSLIDERFLLVDNLGNTFGEQIINANSTSDYEICTMVKDESNFATDSVVTDMLISSNAINDVSVGEITLLVDFSETKIEEPPTIGDVTISISETYVDAGDVLVNFSRTDNTGAGIDLYYVYLYNEDGGEPIVGTTKSTSITLNAPAGNGTYYAVVYGVDEYQNNGLTQTMINGKYVSESEALASATTGGGYVSRSESATLNWTFTVTNSLTGLASDGGNIAYLHKDYNATIILTAAAGSGFFGTDPTMPSDLTITMEGVNEGNRLTKNEHYTFDSSTGVLVIKNVTGNVTISGSSSSMCLIEGTKIRLANGETKNIEDIEYTDLLAVYDYDNGGITYEYPIWIEEGKITNNYQRTTFSDGSFIETYGPHAIFSMDRLGYVSVTDKNNFKIGTKVAKLNKDGSIKIVSVTNIEMKNKKVNYYQVISTRYHNVISNDFITSEGTMITTYGFEHNDDLTWTNDRDKFLKTNDLFYYEDWTQLFPEHIFKGFRMEEAKYLYNMYQFDIELYASILSNLVGDTIMNNEGTNLWMITTSDDVLDGSSNYLKEEGSYYTLKSPNNRINFIGWYNTGDNKMYSPGDKVRVTYGMHFIAKYR